MISLTRKAKSYIDAKKQQNDKITLMFMGGPGKPVKDFCISVKWLRIGTVALSITLIAGLAVGGFFVWDYRNLQYLKSENQQLASINESQSVQIQELQDLAQAMQSKMTDLENLDTQVREKVGLEKPEEATAAGESETQRAVAGLTASRSNSAVDDYDQSENYENIEMLEDLKQELLDMDQQMTEKEDSLTVLSKDVDKKLEKDAATPDFWPMSGRISSRFGWRHNPTGRGSEMHYGLDIANSTGTSIKAAGNGVVTFVGYKAGWGRMVLISHGYGYVTQYAHCSSILVKEGQKVSKGDLIAKCGTSGRVTGAHLHFGVQLNGSWIDPLNVLKK